MKFIHKTWCSKAFSQGTKHRYETIATALERRLQLLADLEERFAIWKWKWFSFVASGRPFSMQAGLLPTLLIATFFRCPWRQVCQLFWGKGYISVKPLIDSFSVL